ncbi:MAG TPA: hypothetical protein VGG41_02295 [Solirubrobacteraceae bacterium]
MTFSPAGDDTVKLDADLPVTVPTVPPAAFVDRALDPPPDPLEPVEAPACLAVADGVVAAAELDVPPHAASPTPSAGTHNATTTPKMRLLGSRRRGWARPGWC